jgi:protein involved in temperature-dependent protein secretion
VLFQVGVLQAASGDLNAAVQALGAAVNASPQFANARYFLAAVYAKQGNLQNALTQVQEIASFSQENATAVASYIAALQSNKNPFPDNLLTVAPTPVE